MLQYTAISIFLANNMGPFFDMIFDLNLCFASKKYVDISAKKSYDFNIQDLSGESGGVVLSVCVEPFFFWIPFLDCNKDWTKKVAEALFKLFAPSAAFTVFFRETLCILTVLSECFLLGSVIVVGIAYILTQNGAGNIAQASLAVVFINEIDNVFYLFFLKRSSRERVENVLVKMYLYPRQETNDDSTVKGGGNSSGFMTWSLLESIGIPFTFAFLVLIVMFGLLSTYCQDY